MSTPLPTPILLVDLAPLFERTFTPASFSLVAPALPVGATLART